MNWSDKAIEIAVRELKAIGINPSEFEIDRYLEGYINGRRLVKLPIDDLIEEESV